jgi:hypothetical protein
MAYNNNKYLVCGATVFNVISAQYVIGGTKLWARPNLAGNRWIVEVQSGSPYYNLSFAKTHQEALAIVAGPEWSEQNDEY